MAAAAAASLQQTPVTFQHPSPSELHSKPPPRLALTSTLKTPKLTIKPLRRCHRGSGGATMSNTASGSYASALADVARNNNTLDKTFADVEKIVSIFSDDSVLRFFANPTIGDAEKRGVVEEIARSSALQPHVANFLNILVEMKRMDLVREIAKEFETVYNDLTKTEVAVVTSVVKLESQHLAQIARGVQKLTGARNVRIRTAIDPGLVAGFTIRYGNSGSKLIDMSVKKQLDEIAAQLELGDIQLAV
ncbi:ATP synthase delta chain, chloroplastic [Salvia divinorum]|uniref:ATP synthase delta chain, chloroplastic n=1 Tax=Salvia divinorum TaxID=28513 RepID=A0ABD1GSS4_SALDI